MSAEQALSPIAERLLAIENLRRAFEAVNRRDFAAMSESFDSEIEWHDAPELPGGGSYHGRERILAEIRSFLDIWEECRIEIQEIVSVDDRLLVLTRFHVRGGGSKVPLDGVAAHACTQSNGKLVRVEAFLSREKALEAVAESVAPWQQIENVRRSYQAFGRGDLDAAFEPLGPDFEWLPPEDALTAGTYRGPEAVKAEVATFTDPFEDFRWELGTIIYVGPQILVEGRMSGRGKGSGAVVSSDEYHVWTIRDGRPVRMRMYRDWTQALKAAGLRE